MSGKWGAILGEVGRQVLDKVRENGPAVSDGLRSGAGTLELGRDLACEAADGAQGAVTVLEQAGVIGRRTAKRARKVCNSVQVAGQVVAVVAGGARGVGNAVERTVARGDGSKGRG